MTSSSAAGFLFLLLSIYAIGHVHYAQRLPATAPAEACKPISQVKGWTYCLESVRHGANISNESNCCSIAKEALMAEAECSCDQRYSGSVDFVSVRKLFAACNVSATNCISDTVDTTQSVEVGNFLVSEKGNFALEFLSPGNSGYRFRYLAIRYGNIDGDNVVWVANRFDPLTDSLGVLRLSPKGNLTLLDSSTNQTLWFSDSSKSLINPVAQLLDTGNLVIRDENDKNSSNYLWQSFDHMGDTLLPGMKCGINLANGQENYLTSWIDENDASIGGYSNQIDTNGVPQIFLKKEDYLGTDLFRAGPWDGLQFSGYSTDIFEFVINEAEIFYRLKPTNNSISNRIRLAPNGEMQSLYWAGKWIVNFTTATSYCDRYGFCGSYGFCSRERCDCLRGFVPVDMGNFSFGCVRRTPLECRDSDRFFKYTGVKLPDTTGSWYDKTIDLKECKELCLRNCSCTAYANLDIRDGGNGCIHWFDILTDIREYNLSGRDLYIKLAASEIVPESSKAHESSKWMIRLLEIIIPLFVGFLTLGFIGRLLISRRTRKLKSKDKGEEEIDLPLFDFKVIATATNNFSNASKLGKGGFGSVYKGVLIDGEHIAVKRLSKNSGQGLKEFKNEVVLIAKLQHRNLVKLLGCCIEGDERILIYEYMPNNSLDSFIFDQTRSKLLDWHKRLQIIGGIARGMLYLHQDSRLRIIHRDLKAGNVLLDNYMNPKISDFGMARMLGSDETADKTRKVVGTYGYMSPEYLVDGHFSIKSDVFSFGVLVLEIVSGRRNRGFSNSNHENNLIGHAWILWLEDRPLELIDDAVGDSYVFVEVLRYIQVGLLCVQKQAKDRPDMSSVVLMLTSEGSLPQPKQPGFFIERGLPDPKFSSSKPGSINEVTITVMDPR